MKEPVDVFLKEFMQHPAWDLIIEEFERVSKDHLANAAASTRDNIDYNRGVHHGFMAAISHMRLLINRYTS